MLNRRDLILQAAAMGGLFTLRETQAKPTREKLARSLRVLILGGTGYIGPHFVRAATARGHKVSVFLHHNSKTPVDLPAHVERLLGDRNGDLQSLKSRDWDIALDLATYVPDWVRTLGQALQGRVGHYTFMSSVAAYEPPRPGQQISESSPLMVYESREDPYTLTSLQNGREYGALKVLCEREAEKQFPGHSLRLRSGYIVGPGDPQGYFTYLPVRMEMGGEVMVAGDPSTSVQFIDVRDLADNSIRFAEAGVTGVYNMVGPVAPTNLGQLLDIVRQSAKSSARLCWVPAPWLASRDDQNLWKKLTFWSYEPEGWAWSMQLQIAAALANGLSLRSVTATLADTLEWYKKQPLKQQAELLWKTKRKVVDPDVEIETVPWDTYLASEKETLALWRAQQTKNS